MAAFKRQELRVYGGKPTFLAMPPGRKCMMTSVVKIAPTNGTARGSANKSAVDTSTSVRLIGWDDELCRPIYGTIRGESTRKQSGSGFDRGSNDDLIAPSSSSTPAKTAQMPQKDYPGKPQDTHSSYPEARLRLACSSKRSYGGRKRTISALSENAISFLADCDHNHAKIPFKKGRSSESSDSGAEISTPAITAIPLTPPPSCRHEKTYELTSIKSISLAGKDSICSVLDSATKKSKPVLTRRKAFIKLNSEHNLKMFRKDPDVKGFMPTLAVDHSIKHDIHQIEKSHMKDLLCSTNTFDGGLVAFDQCDAKFMKCCKSTRTGTAFRSRRKRSGGHRYIAEGTSSIQQQRSKRRQISAATSPSSAKAFFDQLDATHTLRLDRSGQSSPRRGCIRTTRFANLGCVKLRTEYGEYRATAESCGVTPLSLNEYVSQRGSHFQKERLFDGFLDEAH